MIPTLTRPERYSFLSLFCLLLLPAHAQVDCPARLDHSFKPHSLVHVPLYINSRVIARVLPDDRIIVGGQLRSQPGVLRLQADGKLDNTFTPFEIPYRLGQNPSIRAVEVQTDGSVIVGGWISEFEKPLIRLNVNGEYDQGFGPIFQTGSELNPWVSGLAQDANGRLYVSGNFTHAAGIARPGIVRLLPNGTVDETFAPSPTNGVGLEWMSALAVAPDGLLLVKDNELLKLNETGAATADFQRFKSFMITAIAIDPQGRILVGHLQDFGVPLLTRLLPNGAVDESFDLGEFTFVGIGSEGIISIAFQSDGKILAAGSFTDELNRTPAIARFLSDGTLDETFRPLIEQNGWADDVESVTSIAFQKQGGIIIAGDLDEIDGTSRRGIARLYKEDNECVGVVQLSSPEVRVEETAGVVEIELRRTGNLQTAAAVYFDLLPGNQPFITPATAGQDYLVGESKVVFAPGEALKRFGVPIVNDGLVETTETISVRLRDLEGDIVLLAPYETSILLLDDDSRGLPGTPESINYGTNVIVHAIAMDRISRAIVGGVFTSLGGEPRTNIARLRADGTIDPGFYNGGVPFPVRAIHISHDYGTILVGGDEGIVRLHPNGTLDTSFNSVIRGPTPRVTEIVVQPDDKILIAGELNRVNGRIQAGIARLHPLGDVDDTFDPRGGVSNLAEEHVVVTSLALTTEGKILLGGSFSSVAGLANFALVRLNADGSPDRTFTPRLNAAIGAILPQSDGKFLIGGDFDNVNNQHARGLARLTAEGSLDSTFIGDIQIDQREFAITDLHQTWDGFLYVAGKFSFAGTRGHGDSIFRKGLVRMNQDGVVDPHFYTGVGANGSVLAVGPGLDGSVLAGGSFTRFNGEPHESLVRLAGPNHLAPGRLSFAHSGFGGTEESGTVKLQFRREFGTNGTVTAGFQTFDGRAQAPLDFEHSTGMVTFGPGETEKEITITLRDDQEVELWESFEIRLTNGPLGLIPAATVAISDDERGFVFSEEVYQVEEGGVATIHLRHIGELDDSVLLKIETKPGSATSPADYEYRLHQILATPENIPLSFTIPIRADHIPEAGETFKVEITETSRPVAFGKSATVSIREKKEFEFIPGTAKIINGMFQVQARTLPGRSYRVLVSHDLQSWAFLFHEYSFNESILIRDTPPPGTAHRYYRIEEELLY